jgi:hypothetical protein
MGDRLITISYEQLGAAGFGLAVLIWFITVLLKHIAYLTGKLEGHIVYERDTLVGAILESSGVIKGVTTSLDAVKDTLKDVVKSTPRGGD